MNIHFLLSHSCHFGEIKILQRNSKSEPKFHRFYRASLSARLSPPDLPCAPCRSTAANPRGLAPWTWFCLFVSLAAPTILENADTAAAGLLGGVPWEAGPLSKNEVRISPIRNKTFLPGFSLSTPRLNVQNNSTPREKHTLSRGREEEEGDDTFL